MDGEKGYSPFKPTVKIGVVTGTLQSCAHLGEWKLTLILEGLMTLRPLNPCLTLSPAKVIPSDVDRLMC